MCLIVTKPKGKEMPKGKALKRWFNSYPHGFGIAFQYQGKVRLIKGAMTTKEMFALIDKMNQALKPLRSQDIDVIMQFRLAVTGSICPKYCHPFPITSKQEELDSLDVLTDCALAHNGVIYEYANHYGYYEDGYYMPKQAKGDINDAQEFIKDYLAGFGSSLWNPAVQKLIEAYTESRFALLSSKGIVYIGQFIEEKGYWYSNGGYKPSIMSNPEEYTYRCETPVLSEELDDKTLCNGCLQPSLALYYMPDDYESIVCAGCFQYFVGRQPLAEEQVVWG